MNCKICEARKARRHCPGVEGDICSVCCGTEREVTINCPLNCDYLQEARRHERPMPVLDLPNSDVEVSQEFVDSHREPIFFTGMALLSAVAKTPPAVDSDVREALDSLAQTYRTRSTGILYDSHPANPYADSIYTDLEDALKLYQEKRSVLRDAEILGILVIYQGLAAMRDNNRPKSRAYIQNLIVQYHEYQSHVEPQAEEPRLIEP